MGTTGRDFMKKGFNMKNSIIGSSKSFYDERRTVCIKYTNGKVIEKPFITEPWKYIAKVKQAVDVEDAWVKNE